jgi:toxin CptA
MPNSPSSSPASAPCRLEWRPSRWLQAALLILSLLAPLAVLGTELPRPLAWPLALAAAIYGLRSAWKEAGRAPRQLVLAATAGGGDTLDGRPLHDCRIAWRGPLAFVQAIDRDGRRARLVWWPDTLPSPLRRELRLAAAARQASRRDQPMAP